MKTAINTRTPEEYDALMRYYESKGIEWGAFGQATNCPEFWEEYRERMCVTTEHREGVIEYAHTEFFVEKGYEIIPYTEFAKANITESPNYEERYREAVELLEECRLQIEYLHGRFKATGTGISVLLKIDQFLTNHKDGE